MFKRVLFGFLFAFALGLVAIPQARAVSGPDIVGTSIGARDLSITTAWTDLTSASFTSLTADAVLASGLKFTEITVVNTHATQVIYLKLKAGAAGATTHRVAIQPGSSMTIPCYGTYVTTISVYGSGAATTGSIVAQFVSR